MPVTGVPCTCTVAEVAGSRPDTRERVVDLPQPVGPTTVTNSPAATVRSTSVMAVKAEPSRVANLLVAPRSVMAGAVVWLMTGDRRSDVTQRTSLACVTASFHTSGVLRVLLMAPAGDRPPYRVRVLTRSPRRLPLRAQAILFQVAVLALVLVLATLVSTMVLRRDLEQQFEQRALGVARTVAQRDQLATEVSSTRPSLDGPVQRYAAQVRRATGALYVVVTDDAGIRFSHPTTSLIGQRVSTDPSDALAGREVVAIQRGTLGDSARGKVPLRAADGRVVGEVSVGIDIADLNHRMWQLAGLLALVAAAALALGSVGAVALARRLRQATLGLEPEDMADLLREHEAVLGGVRDGVLAVDDRGRVSVCNAEASRLLGTSVSLGVPLTVSGVPDEVQALLTAQEAPAGARARGHPGPDRRPARPGPRVHQPAARPQRAAAPGPRRGGAGVPRRPAGRRRPRGRGRGPLPRRAARGQGRGGVGVGRDPDGHGRDVGAGPAAGTAGRGHRGGQPRRQRRARGRGRSRPPGHGGDHPGRRRHRPARARRRLRRRGAAGRGGPGVRQRVHHPGAGRRAARHRAGAGPADRPPARRGRRAGRPRRQRARRRLPREDGRRAAARGAGRHPRPRGADVIRVLVVDDDFRVARVHASYCERVPGFEVVGTAHTAADAVRLAAETSPDLVLLDEYLPDRPGSSVIGEIGAAVIVISAADDAATVRQALSRGALNFLLKPFAPTVLADRLVAFERFHRSLHGDRQLDQQAVDRAMRMLHEATSPARRCPRGGRR